MSGRLAMFTWLPNYHPLSAVSTDTGKPDLVLDRWQPVTIARILFDCLLLLIGKRVEVLGK